MALWYVFWSIQWSLYKWTWSKNNRRKNENFIYERYAHLQSNEHKYIKVTLEQDDELYVIPYFDNQNFKDRLESGSQLNDKHGIYISRYARGVLEKYYPYLSTDINLSLNVHCSDTMINKKVDTKILGFLKSGIYNYFNKRDNKFIYMYYKDMKTLYDRDDCVGFVAEFNDYNKLKTAKEKYIKQGYHVNDSFIDTEAVDENVSYYKNIRTLFTLVLYAIGIIIVIVLNLNLFMKRRREFSILLINGISIDILEKILIYECLKEIKIPFLLNLFISVGLICIFKTNLLFLFISMIYLMIIIVILLCLYHLSIKLINVEKILRN